MQIIDGKLVAIDYLSELTKEKNLEDTFFDLYERVTGESI